MPNQTKYKIDANNNLVTNNKTTLSGNWSLTDNHNLCLTLDTSKNSKSGSKIILTGHIKDVTKNALLFEISNSQDLKGKHINIVSLKGTWQADTYNQLIFKIKKENSEHDILTFNSTWIINKHHRLIYSYEKADLITKKKRTYKLTFKGYWNMTKKSRMYYELDTENSTGFDFKMGPALLEKNRIKYKLLVGTNHKARTIRLAGQWSLNPKLGLTFTIDYGNNEIRQITIGAKINLSKKDTLSVKLADGAELKLAHDLLDGAGQTFLKCQTGPQPQDYRVECGISFKL
jgi:hypothetical protein